MSSHGGEWLTESKNGPGETRGQMQLGGGRRHEHLPSTSGPVGAESCLEDQR